MKNKKGTINIFEGKISGKISLDKLEFSEVHTRTVEPVSKTSKTGRIYLPTELVHKRVYILVKKEAKTE
ncbi:MAG: hypothetical protein V1886_02560 [archaeon]